MTTSGKAPDASGLTQLQAKIGGMHCSFCAQTIEKAVGRLDGGETGQRIAGPRGGR